MRAQEILRVRAEVEQVLSAHTGQSVQRLRTDTGRDRIFNAQQAVNYGLAEHIISNRVLTVARPA